MNEKRSEPRIPIMARGEASWVDETGVENVAPMTLLDTSPSGACIRVRKSVKVGSTMNVKWHREQFSGTVTNCRLEGEAFILGIKRDAGETHDAKQLVT
jgi:hypothetical protein